MAVLAGSFSQTNFADAGAPTSGTYLTFQVSSSPNPANAGDTVKWTFTIVNTDPSYRAYWTFGSNKGSISGLPTGCTLSTPSSSTGWVWDGYDYYIPTNSKATLSCTTTASSNTTVNATLSGMRQSTGGSTSYSIPNVSASETLIVGTGGSGGVKLSSDSDWSFEKTASSYDLSAPGSVTYTYTVTQVSSTTGYRYFLTPTDDKCTNVTLKSYANYSSGYPATYYQGDKVVWTCTQSLNATTTNTATVKEYYGSSATATATVKVATKADLTVTNTVSPTTIAVGETATWTITVKNTGSVASSTYTLTDALPAGFTNISAPGCTISGTTITCVNQASIPAGGSKTFTFMGTAGTAGTNLTNTATISATTNESSTTNNTASSTLNVTGPADLTITKTANPTAVAPGQTVTFTLTVKNSGASTSSTYTVSDAVPAGYTNVATSTSGCTVSGNTVTCANLAALAPNATKTITLTAVAPSTMGDTTNTASISGTSNEDKTNNSASVTVPVKYGDLKVTKTASNATPSTGDVITYTILVENIGAVTSGTYDLTDAVPSALSSVAFQGSTPSGCSITGNTVSCTNQPAIAAGSSRTFTITAKAGSTGGSVTNTASVTTANDSDTSNNSGSAAVTITPKTPDYTVTKTAARTQVAVGDAVSWDVVVKNQGNAVGSTYTVTDTVPSQFTNVAAAGCTVSGQNVTCSDTSLAVGATKTFTITAIAGTTTGDFTNSASVTSTGESNTSNNSASSTVTIAAAVAGSAGTVTSSDGKVQLTKTANTYDLSAPGNVTYTYKIKNTSDKRLYWTWYKNAKGTLIDDKCSAVTSPSSATGSTGWSADSYGDYYIPSGSTATLSCTTMVKVTTTNKATLSNLVYSDGVSAISNPPSVTAQATVIVAASVPLKDATTLGLSTFKCEIPTVFDGYGAPTQLGAQTQGSTTFSTVSPTWSSTYNAIAFNEQNDLIYGVTQRTSSQNPADENRLVVIDSTGAITDLGVLKIDPDFAAKSISYGTVSGISGGRVASVSTYGEAWNNDIFGGINFGFFDAAGNYWIGNASASGSGVMYQVDLTTGYVKPLANQSAAVRSNDLSYAFGYVWGIKNNANQMMRVDLSTGVVTTFATGIAGMPTGTYGAAWTYGNGNLGFDNNVGGVYQVQIINPGSSSPSFKLVAQSAGPSSSNNDGTSCMGKPTDLSITKTGPGAAVTAGGTATWNIAVTNNGPGISSGFTVVDPIPTNFTWASATWTGGTCSYDTTSKTMTCVSNGTLVVGATSTITVKATAGSTNACYANTASVKGNEADPYAANDTSSVQTCVGTGKPTTCDNVMFGSFGSAGTVGKFGTVVSGTTIAATAPTGVVSLPTTGVDRYSGTSYSIYSQTSAMAIDTLDPNYIYYTGRNDTTFGTSLYRYDMRTKTSTIMSTGSAAWTSNRLAVAPDGTVWSFANDGHIYSYNPAMGDVAPTDWGIIQSVTATNPDKTTTTLDFKSFSSGDIAFDGAGNMWILASTGQDASGNYGPTYLLTVSASQLGSVASPVPTVVGKMTSPAEGYYNGIAFGSDGTLYASTLGASNYIYVVSPKDGSTVKKGTYSTTGNGSFGDLGSCALPKPNLTATKTVSPTTSAKAGDTLTYTITVKNTGNLAATGVQVMDELPAGAAYVAGSTTMNTKPVADVSGRFPYSNWLDVQGAGDTFAGVISPGGTATITFQVKIDAAYTGNKICNQGNVKYTSRELNGVILTDNTATSDLNDATCTIIQQPAFAVEKTAANPTSTDATIGQTVQVNPDGTVTVNYNVKVTNTGDAPGNHPVITDNLTVPNGFSVTGVTVTPQGGAATAVQQTAGTFLIPASTTPLAAKASTTYTVSVTMRAADLNAVDWTSAGKCSTTAGGDPAQGAFNKVTMNADTDGTDNNDACVPVTPPTKDLTLSKVAANCDTNLPSCPLGGAEFALYDIDPSSGTQKPIKTGITDVNGTTVFQGLNLERDYWLVETKSPKGFQLLSTPIKFRLTATGIVIAENDLPQGATVTANSFNLTVKDTTVPLLPKAGGEGPLPFAGVGLLLMLAAGLYHKKTS